MSGHRVLKVLKQCGDLAAQPLPRLVAVIDTFQGLLHPTSEPCRWFRRPSARRQLQLRYRHHEQAVGREAFEHADCRRAALGLLAQAPLESDLAVLSAAEAIGAGPP